MPKVKNTGEVEVEQRQSSVIGDDKKVKINLDDYNDLGTNEPVKQGTKEDNKFFGHGTHKSMQKNEEAVKVSGDGFKDSSVPKTPKTDCFYDNVSNWRR